VSSSFDDIEIFQLLGGDPVATAPATVPLAQITSPAKPSLKAKSFTDVTGTAGPAGSVAKVEVAIRRIDKRRLKKQQRCLWLKSAQAKFKSVKALNQRCAAQRWLSATGKEHWSFHLKRPLPKGSYEIFVRTLLTDGRTQTSFGPADGDYRKLKLK
jgi:hypothetical protein